MEMGSEEMKYLLQHLSSSSSSNVSSVHHHSHNQFPLSQQQTQLSGTHHTQLHRGLSASTAISSHHIHIPTINSTIPSSSLLTSAALQQHRNTSPSISGQISGTATVKTNNLQAARLSSSSSAPTQLTQAHHHHHHQQHTESKPVATVPPLSTLPANMHIPSNLALQKAALLVAAQQASVSRAVAAASVATATASSKDVVATSNCGGGVVGSQKKQSAADSRWSGADERLLFLAGPRLKMLRRRICTKRIIRPIALHPCRPNDFVTKQLPNLQGFFI